MRNKRGQAAAGAAVLLAVIMGLIIFFILILQPSERAALLGEATNKTTVSATGTSATSKTTVQENLLRKSPGHLSYLKDTEIERLIASTNIYTKDSSAIVTQESTLSIKNGAFSSQEKKVIFTLNDLKNTKNLYLDFSVEKFEGKLTVLLNNKIIFDRATNKIKPIKLPTSSLSSSPSARLSV